MQAWTLLCLLAQQSLVLNGDKSANRLMTSDIREINIDDILTEEGSKSGTNKILTLVMNTESVDQQEKENKKTALLESKPLLFRSGLKIEECARGVCAKNAPNKKTLDNIGNCSYTGRLDGDPDSVLALSNCRGAMTLSLVSTLGKLKSTTYGRSQDNIQTNCGALKSRDYKTIDSVEMKASSVLTGLSNGTIFFNIDEDLILFLHTYKHFVSKNHASGCCSVVTRKCYIYETDHLWCSKQKFYVACGRKCVKLRKRFQRNSKVNLRQLKNEAPMSAYNEGKFEKNNSLKKDIQGYADPLVPRRRAAGEALAPYPLALRQNWKKKSVIEALTATLKQTESIQGVREPPTHLVQSVEKLNKRVCLGACHFKWDNPEKNIYKERTIELGIAIDRFLWENMEGQVDGGDDEVMEAMLTMLHSVIASTEAHLLHKSISASGGFRLVINGLFVWKDDSVPEAKKIHDTITEDELFTEFEDFVAKKNHPYDGYEESYDIMLLLSGAHKKFNIEDEGTDAGLSHVGSVCKVVCPLMLTIELKNGTHLCNAGALLAHEMGHMLGAYHDGDLDRDRKVLNCPTDRYIMTPIQKSRLTEWSECSRRQIDSEYERREREEPKHGNCFLT